MQYADKMFDTIVMYNAIGHLSTILALLIKECQRVLKTGGAILIISSLKMDKCVIYDALLPLLDSQSISYLLSNDKHFEYIRL